VEFVRLAEASDAVRETSGRKAKVALLAGALRELEPDEVAAGTAFLAGELLQRQIGVGYASLRTVPPPAAQPSLSVSDVAGTFAEIGGLSGAGSQAARRLKLADLFGAATEREQHLLRGLLSGGLRQGALAGVMTDAIATAADVPLAAVRRAAMLTGDLPAVAALALAAGVDGIADLRLELLRPVQPMLASTAKSVGEALEQIDGVAAVEFKLDGARIQVHRDGERVGVYTRSLDDVTARVPEIVAAALELKTPSFVLDGEAIALREDGSPHPFQVTAARFGSRGRSDVPLTGLFFDVLQVEGDDLLDAPAVERAAALDRLGALQVPRIVTGDPEVAQQHLDAALAAGHEGVVVKSLDVPYEAGRRGKGWLKVKPVHTLDLVVLAVEHGSGRRRGWLSNLHLGARDPEGGFVMLGKTFKGLTDEMLKWQTEYLRSIAIDDNGWVVHVRPELVVEIAFDGVQTSPRYPGGVALRFARVLRHRPDKRAAEADTLDAVLAFRR
jgi:DNA ligase-1